MKTNKTLYAALAFAPLVLLLGVFVMFFITFAEAFDHPGRYTGNAMPAGFFGIMAFTTLISIVGVVGLVMYLMHVTKNTHIPKDSRTMWILIVALAGVIGMIIYYFTWINKEDELNAKLPKPEDQWK